MLHPLAATLAKTGLCHPQLYFTLSLLLHARLTTYFLSPETAASTYATSLFDLDPRICTAMTSYPPTSHLSLDKPVFALYKRTPVQLPTNLDLFLIGDACSTTNTMQDHASVAREYYNSFCLTDSERNPFSPRKFSILKEFVGHRGSGSEK